MRGLVLEGGAARGAYHIGVVMALAESGYEFEGFAGTSIGAINAAMLLQGDFELALELWEQISMEQIFDIDEKLLLELANVRKLRFDRELPQKLMKAVAKIIENKGINTNKMKAFLETYINESEIRASGKDYGLVTVSVSERKPYELMLEDIPQGKLLSYIMASASFPGFRPEEIDGRVFVDGALYDNCPVNLLLRRYYDEIIAVRTNAPGIKRKPEDTATVRYISPSRDLGNLMRFSPENSMRNIQLGYEDGLRFLENE